MVLQTGQLENSDIAECGVANITSGRRTGWFRKMKNNSAKAKWLSDSNWRFFTLDFDDHVVFYSNSESQSMTKPISSPIAFRDIVEVKLLDRKLQRGLTERLFGAGVETHTGLILITCDREMRLLCSNLDDAKKWVSIFNTARKLGQVASVMVKSPSRGSMSTEPGSDEGPPQLSDTDSGEPGLKRELPREAVFEQEPVAPTNIIKPFETNRLPLPVQEFSPWVTPTPEPGSKPQIFFEPDFGDAFAALEALQDELGPIPTTPEAPKVDAATAIKEAKAKRAEKKKGDKEAPKDGYSSTAMEKPVPRNLHKEMSVEDRNARDMALLQKVQMPLATHRSSKAREADKTSPLKQTKPLKSILKMTNAWDESTTQESTSNLKQGCVSENASQPGKTKEGVRKEDDTNSWDGDAEEVQFEKGDAIAITTWGVHNDSRDGSGDKNEKISMPDPASKDDDPWDSDEDKMERKVPKSFCGQSEGKIDHSSWDDDEGEQRNRSFKKIKSLNKRQEVEEDDPTAGLDDLVDSVSTGNPVSVPIPQYVNGFQCTQCDFKVIRFTGFQWGPKAEYLYFRNYYGKPHKLKKWLTVNANCSAYCCQCNFKSVPSELELRDVKDGTRWKVIG